MFKVYLGSNPVDNESMLTELEANRLVEGEDFAVQNEQPEEGEAYILVPKGESGERKMVFPFDEEEFIDVVTDYMMGN